MKKISIITNFNIPDKARAALKVADKLESLGCTVFVASFNRERIARNSDGVEREYINYIPVEKLYSAAELVVLLGGDGTILEAARRAVPTGRPMLGINLGRLGYMAELEINEIDLLEKVVNDEFTIDKRMMIKVEIFDKNGVLKNKTFGLNDAVVSNGSVARIVDLQLFEDGNEISTYRADGLIVATPTGSTAYSMSAGGAIVEPRVACLCVTPICPHSFAAKPMIFPDNAILEIKNVCQSEKSLFVTVDGRSNTEIAYGDTVRVTRSELSAKLVRIKNNGFYGKLRSKMSSGI